MVIGCDISLNHGGFCLFDVDGSVISWMFFHDVKKYVKAYPEHGILTEMKRGKDETPHAYDVRRASHYAELFSKHVAHPFRLDGICFSIEGYAIHQGSNSTNRILQIAELTGVLKNIIYTRGGMMRIHDPLSVKMYAYSGKATKREMREAAGADGFVLPDDLFKETKKDLDGPGTDVVDAYWLGKMLVTELKLRSGELVMSDLPENQIKVFNRVTKAFPVNVLARPFIGDTDD
jgi:hypothetical protein